MDSSACGAADVGAARGADSLALRGAPLLREAADLIERHGLVRGRYGDFVEGFCTIGAIGAAAEIDPLQVDWRCVGELAALCATIGRPPKMAGQISADEEVQIYDWNDGADSQEQVVTTLREAADAFEAQRSEPAPTTATPQAEKGSS